MSGIVGGGAQGALGGATTGATIGSIIPGIGTAIGAGIGALGGGLLGGIQGAQQNNMAASGAAKLAQGDQSGLPAILQAATMAKGSAGPGSMDALLGPEVDPSFFKFGAGGLPAAQAAAGMTPPAATPAPGTQTAPVPMIQPQPAWKEALAATAMTQDMLMKSRPRPGQAPEPHLFIPQGVKAPTFGSPVTPRVSPLQAYAAMLRR
jgi:hypothetical protein